MRVATLTYAAGLVVLSGCGDEALDAPNSPRCETVATTAEIAVSNVDPLDVVVVLDSEAEELDAIDANARAVARLVRVMLDGEDPSERFVPPVRDLHLAIVTSDASEGLVLAQPSADGDDACSAPQTPFLRYFTEPLTVHPRVAPPSSATIDEFLERVVCAARLEPSGGAQAPIDAAREVLRASQDGGVLDGFLRDDPSRGLSSLYVLFVRDGSFCSDEELALAAAAREALSANRPEELLAVHTLCDGNWQAALDWLAPPAPRRQIGSACMPRRYARDAEGLTPCQVFWELPTPDSAPPHTPTRCDDRAFLTARPDRHSERGGAVCEVNQLAVVDDADGGQLEPGSGFFLDRGRPSCTCAKPDGCDELVFAPNPPPTGVTVRVECAETRVLDCAEGQDCDASVCQVPG